MPRTRRDAAPAPRLIEESYARELRALRDRKMAACLHAYMRGSASLFYASIDEARRATPIAEGPAVWISGDCHAENIGAIPTGETGVAHLALNDLDCAVIGNPAYDLLRLALSLSMATMQQGRSGDEVLASARAVVDGYLHAAVSDAPAVLPERLEKLLKHASKESRRELLDKRAPRKHGARRFAFGDRYTPLSPSVRADLVAALEASEGVRAILGDAVAKGDAIEVVDVAFRVAGTGSLGCFRAAALVRSAASSARGSSASDHDDEDDALFLVDVKEASVAPTPRAATHATPADEGARLVAASEVLWGAANGPAPMAALTLHGRPCAMRVLRPQEDKLAVDALSPEESRPIARSLGEVVGRAHARQLSAADRHSLVAALGGDIDGVARWMNPMLATLIGRHASAYLDHVVQLQVSGSGAR